MRHQDFRTQLLDSMLDVDDVYGIGCGDAYGSKEVEGVAMTRQAVERRRSEIESEEPLKTLETEPVGLYT